MGINSQANIHMLNTANVCWEQYWVHLLPQHNNSCSSVVNHLKSLLDYNLDVVIAILCHPLCVQSNAFLPSIMLFRPSNWRVGWWRMVVNIEKEYKLAGNNDNMEGQDARWAYQNWGIVDAGWSWEYSGQQSLYNVLYFWKDMSIVHEVNILNPWKYYGRYFNFIPNSKHSNRFTHQYLVGLSHDAKWQLIAGVLLHTFWIWKTIWVHWFLWLDQHWC